MNDDDLELRTYAGRGSGDRRPARPAPAVRAYTLPAAPVRTPPMSPVRPRAVSAAWSGRGSRRVTEQLPVVHGPPPPPAPARSESRITRELPVPPPAPAIEQILQILRAPPEWGESVKGAFSRKERELAAVFDGLDSEEAGKLFRRLSNPQPDDPVAASFARLVPERRGRLLGFLISARRRAELAQVRRPPPQPRRDDE